MPAGTMKSDAATERPRERILRAAGDMFYRQGVRAVGVEAVAEAAGTNKMTLYRHFASKDELVAECLRQAAEKMDTCWAELDRKYPGDPLAQLRGWLKRMADHVDGDERGCALANAAIELAERGHPARRVIEDYKRQILERLAGLARSAGLSEPDMLADELHLLLEGTRVTAQSVGRKGLGDKLVRISEALIAAHGSGKWAVRNKRKAAG